MYLHTFLNIHGGDRVGLDIEKQVLFAEKHFSSGEEAQIWKTAFDLADYNKKTVDVVMQDKSSFGVSPIVVKGPGRPRMRN